MAGTRSLNSHVYHGALVSSGPAGQEESFEYSDGHPQGISLGPDSALGVAGSVLASAQLASEAGTGVIAPCAHSDQYIDDADCSVAVSHDCDVSEVARLFCDRLQSLLRSEVDLLKSSMGEETGIMTGRNRV